MKLTKKLAGAAATAALAAGLSVASAGISPANAQEFYFGTPGVGFGWSAYGPYAGVRNPYWAPGPFYGSVGPVLRSRGNVWVPGYHSYRGPGGNMIRGSSRRPSTHSGTAGYG